MSDVDPVLEALEAEEGDMHAPAPVGFREMAEPPEVPDRDAPPQSEDLQSGTARVAMSGYDEDEEEPEEEEGSEAEVFDAVDEEEVDDDDDEISVDSDGEGEGEEPAPDLLDDSPSSDLSLDEAFETTFGAKPTVEQSTFLLGLARDLQSAEPERVAYARQVLAGYDPAQPQQPQPEPQPEPEPVYEFEPIPIPEYVDEDSRRTFEAFNDRQRQMAEWQAQQAAQTQQIMAYQQQQVDAQRQAQAQARHQAMTQGALHGRDRFVEDHPGLSDTDVAVLTEAAQNELAYAGFLQARENDPNIADPFEAAAYDTYRTVLSKNDVIAHKLTQAQIEQEVEKRKTESTRKRKASAIAGAASAPPSSPGRSTSDELKEGLLAELRNGALG